MSDKTRIEWTDATWNPVTGCSKVSQGCKHCYAEREWPRISAPRPQPNIYTGRAFTEVQCHPERLLQPWSWVKPRRIFVNSMSDLFHEDVPFEFIAQVFWIMGHTTRHTYQVLTKRPHRMLEFFKWVDEYDGTFPGDRIGEHAAEVKWEPATKGRGGYDNCGPSWPYSNVWLGVSVEDQATAEERIPLLLQIPAAVSWISAEPLLGPVDLVNLVRVEPGIPSEHHYSALECDVDPLDDGEWNGRCISWVVVGGESGPKARPMHPDWVRSLRDQCAAADVPFFFKQWGEWAPSIYSETPGIESAGGNTEPSVAWPDLTIAHGSAAEHGGKGIMLVPYGKKDAGDLLDGVQHHEFPEVPA